MANQIIWWIVRTFGSFYVRHLTTPSLRTKRRFAPLAIYYHKQGSHPPAHGGKLLPPWLQGIAEKFRQK